MMRARRQVDRETRGQGDKEFPSPCLPVYLSPCLHFFKLFIPHSFLVLLAFVASSAVLAQDRPTSSPASSGASSKAEISGDRSLQVILPPRSEADQESGRV